MIPVRVSSPSLAVWGDSDGLARVPFDSLLDRLFNPGTESPFPIDLYEDAEHLHVEAELPGLQKNEVEVTVENGILTIAAEQKLESSEANRKYYRRERVLQKMMRRMKLPVTVDETRASAKFENGVLHVTMPKHEAAKMRRIELK